ncbi:MAG: glutamate synthase-related protein [Bacilli bacterium]
MQQKEQWSPSSFKNYHLHEHDACGIVSVMEKRRIPTKANIDACLDTLTMLNHRAGFINEEGDGVGIHIDLPRALWKVKLAKANLDESLVDHNTFAVGHVFIDNASDVYGVKDELLSYVDAQGWNVLYVSTDEVNSTVLGPLGQAAEPLFLQFAVIAKEAIDAPNVALFRLTLDLEAKFPVHVSSLHTEHAVYKVMGSSAVLRDYYKDLTHEAVASTMTLGHNRYSTNTLSNFFRVQPFSLLGHNGEINTIEKLRSEARLIGTTLTDGGSDSQDLNRTIDTLIQDYGFSLFEAVDTVFPPIISEMKAYPAHLNAHYTYMREAWGHFAQGPAGIISRYSDEAVFSLDSLGLRPLWKLETESSFFFCSEPGIVSVGELVSEPKPLAPGEKLGLKWDADGVMQVFDNISFQEEVYNRMKSRLDVTRAAGQLEGAAYTDVASSEVALDVSGETYSAFGWDREHIQLVEQMAEKGAEPIRSLGHDAPLAAIDVERRNIPDFIKESVAVVTNPAIDRDREIEHFSTRVIVGKRPSLKGNDAFLTVELPLPICVEGPYAAAIKEGYNQPSYEQLVHYFQEHGTVATLSTTFTASESIQEALVRLGEEAAAAVQSGASLVVLDDNAAHQDDQLWLDPHLVTASVANTLGEKGLRRDTAIVVRSGAIRSLHDIITLLGLGADVINPYVMFRTVEDGSGTGSKNLFSALQKGLEKVISTIGIHELRGYGRLFSSIGLNDEVASALGIVNFFGGKELAYNFDHMKQDAVKRADDYQNEKAKARKSFHLFPRVWKAIGDVAATGSYESFRAKVDDLEKDAPTCIRHLADFKQVESNVDPVEVSIQVGEHSLPFVISSMSFGSQNETAFRAYAEAAEQLNMVSLNGEGGEIKDMLGKYPRTRGQQVASGRFGVNAELLNSSNLLEIKIGQGAKPGEGGHLPASKVTAKIAEARNATVGSDLISPSNNHDIYSIEDLAQMVAELKTANDQARIAVKVPVVPNIGTIAVGIAKAGADIIAVSGFDGGTGAARIHALTHVGLPVEIGVKAAHNALIEAGMRHQVEIWADGGVKSASDVLKLMLLGANRIGFGTLSMIAIGCTTCRGCHLDTCHVGIATQIESEAQAKDHGLRRFTPREYDKAVSNLKNFFSAFGEELKRLTAALGVTDLQSIVGKSEYLEQTRGIDQLNLQLLIEQLEVADNVATQTKVEHILTPSRSAAINEFSSDWNEETLLESRTFENVRSDQRILASRVSCHRVRGRLNGGYNSLPDVKLHYRSGSVPGNGFAAYTTNGINIIVEGGAQDGMGKTAFGGHTFILKAKGKDGRYYNGSVGKGFGYGAQKGLLVAQGNADSRTGIRLSGADMIIGGHVTTPISADEGGNIAVNSNIKGFAFEYMTNGRGLVVGDPGPWMCAGMTGGVIYTRHQPEMGLTKAALERRIAKGANVSIYNLDAKGIADVQELLGKYLDALREVGQQEEIDYLTPLYNDPKAHFFMLIPTKEQADPSVSTE